MTNGTKFTDMEKYFISYEDFGAAGDGITDDFESIKKAHEYANKHHLPVRSNPVKTYYIGENFFEIPVMTDIDWSESKFIIDDSNITPENRFFSVFQICSAQKKIKLNVPSIKKGQKKIDVDLPSNALVIATNENKKQFIRFGLNQNTGTAQTDCFIVDKSGYILTPVVWDFENITSITAYPIDERTLKISGGIFISIANQAESKYTYYNRNIKICRSNVIVDRLVHNIEGELDHGAPYGGFLLAEACSNVSFKNCHVTGHKIYTTIGSAQLPVPMGSYDISLTKSINISFYNCRQNDIMNTSLWGCFTMNGCKNITIDGCTFSRVDAHMDVTNYTVKNSVLGWQGLKAIGHGKLLVENTTIFCYAFIELRSDYGSNWDGDVEIQNCIWYPTAGNSPTVLSSGNPGDHDFGYTCSLPSRLSIKNFKVMDGDLNTNEYKGPCIFNANINKNLQSFEIKKSSDYPYIFTEKLYLKCLSSQSGKGFRIWTDIPVNCYCNERHQIEEEKVIPNFKAYIDDVEYFTLENSRERDVFYGNNHRLIPYLEIKNCENVNIEQGVYPVIIKKE